MSEEINRLEELAALIQSEVPRIIGEATDAINESITVALEEAQESESDAPAKLKLAITATWNLDTNAVEVSMPVAVKRKFTRTAQLPDHNQKELPFTAVRKIAEELRAAGVKVTTNAKLNKGGSNE